MGDSTWLLVGLGNPGTEYARTRHNVGAWLLDVLRKELGLPDFSFDRKSNALVTKNKELGIRNNAHRDVPDSVFPIPYSILLAFPQTFMNDSGSSVRALADYYHIPPDRILLLHDEKDLPFGKLRLEHDRSSAGHKGVQSVMEHLGTQAFWRLRIGIGSPPPTLPLHAFVLQAFSDTEQEQLRSDVFPRALSDLTHHFQRLAPSR